MRTAWAALPFAVVALGLTACGDDEGSKDEGAATATATATGGYPSEVRENFLKGCEASGGEADKCKCALDKLEDQVSFEDFKAADAAARGGEEGDADTTKRIESAIRECA